MDGYAPACIVDSWSVFDSASCLRKLEDLSGFQWFTYDASSTGKIYYDDVPFHLPTMANKYNNFGLWWLSQRQYVLEQPEERYNYGLNAWKRILDRVPPNWNVVTFRNIVANWSLDVATHKYPSYDYRLYEGGYAYQQPQFTTSIFNPSLTDVCVFARTFGLQLSPKQPVWYSGSKAEGYTYSWTGGRENYSPNLVGLRRRQQSSSSPSISIGFYFGNGSFIPVGGTYDFDTLKFILQNVAASQPNNTVIDTSKMDATFVQPSPNLSDAPLRYTAKLWYDSWSKAYYPTQDYMWDRSHSNQAYFGGHYYDMNQLQGLRIIEKIEYQYVVIEFDDPRVTP